MRHWKVLLLEAGPEEPTTTSVPAFAVTAIGTHLDWKYRTEPQTTACKNNGGVCKWPRGKMIAGTGAMTGNHIIYIHRHFKQYATLKHFKFTLHQFVSTCYTDLVR